MKNCFLVPVVFIVNFCFWLLASSLFLGIWQYLLSNPQGLIFLTYSFFHYLYLLTPVACTIAIFSVYVFLMRHHSKVWLSFLLLFFTFAVFFAAVIPQIYSQGKKIDVNFYSAEKMPVQDQYLEGFISPPNVIQRTIKLINPIITDIYSHYTVSYKNYLIFAGAFFFFIFSLWVCTVIMEWKIINFALLPFFTLLSAYGYSFAVSPVFKAKIKALISLPVPDFWIIPACFTAAGLLFLLYTVILLTIRRSKTKYGPPKIKRQKIRLGRIKKAKPEKSTNFSSRRRPRQSRRSRKNKDEE